jgi:hypothetical protein
LYDQADPRCLAVENPAEAMVDLQKMAKLIAYLCSDDASMLNGGKSRIRLTSIDDIEDNANVTDQLSSLPTWA